jgi:2-hydroxychromene-2-carboxylate isomerase
VSEQPVFYYDFSSPYAYLSAHRIDELLPAPVRWQPILFGALIAAIGKEPWSWPQTPGREERMRECEQRAMALGLPLSWPRDWPKGTYSILVARAALVAEEQGRLREFSLAAFSQGLGLGRDLTDIEVVFDAADEAGVGREALRAGVARDEIKQRLRAATDVARERGVTGIPTVAVGDELFWGDDRLEDAARAAAR